MAKPYREGSGWCMRQRYRGHDIYVSGCSSQAAAQKEVRERIAAIDLGGKPQHLGPQRTTLAYALQEFGLEHLPHLKGAQQEVRRINRYLEAAGIQPLAVQPATAESTMHYEVTLKPVGEQRRVPQGLGAHRKALLTKTASADRVRQVLAQTPVANITRLELQRLVDALARSGLAPATIGLERAVLRRFFNHARKHWSWAQPGDNPARDLTMPRIDNARERVLSHDEQAPLEEQLEQARNPKLYRLYELLLATGMRASEPLLHATWSSVDWQRCILTLKDGKDGKREVPLSPAAINALKALGPGEPHQRLVNITYEALKAGFRRACERAGVQDLHLHDLRHTAATRLAKGSGNRLLVKALTGHKTDAMVMRYTHVNADDVVEFLHKEGSAGHPEGGAGVFTASQVQALIEKAVQEALARAAEQATVLQPEPEYWGANVVPLRRAAA